ncbi:MAG: hypothetical protein DRJ52_01850 [Thermoprotei archaeon]|nr:MAG: hypothetical protein DRJ52_01850 [Thermoprotei archaeon]
MSIKIVDVHAHLTHELFASDLDLVLRKAVDSGVVKVITSTLRYYEIEEALRIKNNYRNMVEVTIGCWPGIFDYKEIDEIMEKILSMSQSLVGVGEVGLDFSLVRDHVLRSIQIENFRKWLRIADELALPLILHIRRAEKVAYRILKAMSTSIPVIFHAYSGSLDLVKDLIKEKNFFFSIPPSVCKSNTKQRLVSLLPIEKILLESDAPYLHPFGYSRNEPLNVVYSLSKIASIKRMPIEDLAAVIYSNTLDVFRLR